jgi:hypothetical protein
VTAGPMSLVSLIAGNLPVAARWTLLIRQSSRPARN